MRLGGRRRKGIDLEYFERVGGLVDDDTMANGEEEASVMFLCSFVWLVKREVLCVVFF